MKKLLEVFLPNRVVSKTTLWFLAVPWIALFLLTWSTMKPAVMPGPGEVLSALGRLWTEDALAKDLMVSMKLNVQALFWSALISLTLTYATVLTIMRPPATFVSGLRFLSLTGLAVIFTVIASGGHQLKLWLLTFGVTVFLVPSLKAVLDGLRKEQFDHARTLGMNEWQVTWEVVVLGTRDQMIEAFRQNAAIGWMMLTMVEGLVRSEGGVGTVLLNQNKHFKLDAVFAIQLAVLMVGLFQDWLIGAAKRLICPYAHLKLERK